MATTTNKAITSHDKGPEPRPSNTDYRTPAEPRTTKIVDQGPEQKSYHKKPSRESAADRDEFPEYASAPAEPPVIAAPVVDQPEAATGDPDSIAHWNDRKGIKKED